MCTVVVLRRPDHAWPVLLAANRDEMVERPWRPPARHWPDRPEVIAGLDEHAGGTWLGLNDFGVVAGILNRPRSLGPATDKRSRGELVLEALDHADAVAAATALGQLDGRSYRAFNMVIADNRDGYWLRSTGEGRVQLFTLPEGVSMLTAFDLDSNESVRTRRFLPQFRNARAPDPESGDWRDWEALLATRAPGDETDPNAAMTISTDFGFGTVSSALIALPAVESAAAPVYRFAAGPPDRAPYRNVPL